MYILKLSSFYTKTEFVNFCDGVLQGATGGFYIGSVLYFTYLAIQLIIIAPTLTKRDEFDLVDLGAGHLQ